MGKIDEEEYVEHLQDAASIAEKYGYCSRELLIRKIPCSFEEAEKLLNELSDLKIIEDDYSAQWRKTYLNGWEAMERIDEVYHIYTRDSFDYLKPWE